MITERQREVLCLLPLTNRQIGAVLGIRLSTVKGHLTGLYRDLLGPDPKRCHRGARIKVLTEALAMGIIEIDDIVDGECELIARRG